MLRDHPGLGHTQQTPPMARYTAFSLDRSRIAQAYPLVQAATGLSLAQWRRFALSILAKSGAARADRGVRCLAGPDGYINGLYRFLTAEHMTCGRILLCSDVVALDIVGVADAERALYADMDAVARRLGCRAVHVQMPTGTGGAMPAPGVERCLADQGFVPEAVEMCRKLAAD